MPTTQSITLAEAIEGATQGRKRSHAAPPTMTKLHPCRSVLAPTNPCSLSVSQGCETEAIPIQRIDLG